jgi:hypothetical protein
MVDLVADLCAMFPGIETKWGALAQGCATSCSFSVYACRSFQIVRLLVPHIRVFIVDDMLVRMVESVSTYEPYQDEIRS